jgi:hypothetical protein
VSIRTKAAHARSAVTRCAHLGGDTLGPMVLRSYLKSSLMPDGFGTIDYSDQSVAKDCAETVKPYLMMAVMRYG